MGPQKGKRYYQKTTEATEETRIKKNRMKTKKKKWRKKKVVLALPYLSP